MRSHVLITLLIPALVVSVLLGATDTQPAPPGSYVRSQPELHRKAETFKSGEPLIGTSYFYWYDAPTRYHVFNEDGSDALTHHPASGMPELTFKSAEWHRAQLRDVTVAGIDFIMPVYWGVPGVYRGWSVEGLPPLVAAHDRMLAEHEKDPKAPAPPRIGLFYDTSTLQYYREDGPRFLAGEPMDLTTPPGRAWFYNTIRDFFSLIPPAKWARIDGRPIVFLYSPDFAKAIDEKCLDEARRRFEADFGCGMFLVRHAGWPGKTDAWYQWGGAVRMTLGDVVAAIGPGYDHSAVPGRTPLIVDREKGRFYDRQWQMLLRMDPVRRPWLVHVETWNEWHEGSDVARSKEYGDQYIKATARYARMFRDRVRPSSDGKYTRVEQIRWTPEISEGLRLLNPLGDGCWKLTTQAGVAAVVTQECAAGQTARYLYFDVDDSYLFSGYEDVVEITVRFLDDGGCAQFRVDYDNSNPLVGPRGGAFRPTQPITVGDKGDWREYTFVLPQVRFVNAANAGDFRLSPEGGRSSLTVSELVVRKKKSPQS